MILEAELVAVDMFAVVFARVVDVTERVESQSGAKSFKLKMFVDLVSPISEHSFKSQTSENANRLRHAILQLSTLTEQHTIDIVGFQCDVCSITWC